MNKMSPFQVVNNMFPQNDEFEKIYKKFFERAQDNKEIEFESDFRIECNRFTKIAKRYLSDCKKFICN